MTATKTSHAVIALDKAAHETAKDGRAFVRVRRELGIEAFGVNASYQASAGERVVGEHDELNPGAGGHEELYVIVNGAATFTIDGEEVEVPQGSAVNIAPESRRSAIATEDDTLVLIVGGKRGEAYAISPSEAMGAFFERYNKQDYAGALKECKAAFDKYPGNALVLFNVALHGEHARAPRRGARGLEESVTKWPKFKEQAAGDDDFASLRDDPRFQQLIA